VRALIIIKIKAQADQQQQQQRRRTMTDHYYALFHNGLLSACDGHSSGSGLMLRHRAAVYVFVISLAGCCRVLCVWVSILDNAGGC